MTPGNLDAPARFANASSRESGASSNPYMGFLPIPQSHPFARSSKIAR
jgi:hypothetical protein